MMAATTNALTGSNHVALGTNSSTTPESSTAADPSASPAMWSTAERMFKSLVPSRSKRTARPLAIMATAAMITTVPAWTAWGSCSRRMLSTTITTVTAAIAHGFLRADPDGDRGDSGSVPQRGEDGRPVVAERAGRTPGAEHKAHRHQRQE